MVGGEGGVGEHGEWVLSSTPWGLSLLPPKQLRGRARTSVTSSAAARHSGNSNRGSHTFQPFSLA